MIGYGPSSMKRQLHIIFRFRNILAATFLAVISLSVYIHFSSSVHAQGENKRLITVYDRETKSSFLTDKKTLGEALKDKGIELDPRDTVEPSRNEELVADDYRVNIYRARPVVVVDGTTRVKIMTPYQTSEQIAKDAGITVYPEDKKIIKPSEDFVGDGAGLEFTIQRATPMVLDLYSTKTAIRTQGKTVGEMLKEKGIVLGVNGRVSVPETTPITAGMEVRVWREGKQTISVDQAVPFSTEKIFDADRLVNYKAVQTAGIDGVRSISYEIEVKDGKEISRTEIASIVTKQPIKQTVVVGIKSFPGALTKAKGAQMYTDSKGVTHRETYYDLNMSTVMQACGQGGYYEVRVDGMKVDRDGYIIVAANYGRYPRCSIVETSAGPAKVYDTGGFATRYPDGFDLATDWSQPDGR